jgi:hypothetical protein
MKIEDCTQTKDGTEVKILERRRHFALGYWIDGFGCAHPAKWDNQGLPKETTSVDSESEHDLRLDLHDWEDEIPWGWLIDAIRLVMRDKDGLWWGYTSSMNKCWTLNPFKMPANAPRHVIAKRPEGR